MINAIKDVARHDNALSSMDLSPISRSRRMISRIDFRDGVSLSPVNITRQRVGAADSDEEEASIGDGSDRPRELQNGVKGLELRIAHLHRTA